MAVMMIPLLTPVGATMKPLVSHLSGTYNVLITVLRLILKRGLNTNLRQRVSEANGSRDDFTREKIFRRAYKAWVFI